MTSELHMIVTKVHGYHVYKEIWCATVREELSRIKEAESYHDTSTIAVVESGTIIGHVSTQIILTVLR